MSEPIIPNPSPVTIPAVSQKVYDKLYVPHTTISAKPNQPWNCVFTSVSYDGDNAILDDNYQIQLRDIKALAAIDSDIAQAMGAMLAVLGKYAVLCKAAGVKKVDVTNIAALLAQGA